MCETPRDGGADDVGDVFGGVRGARSEGEPGDAVGVVEGEEGGLGTRWRRGHGWVRM